MPGTFGQTFYGWYNHEHRHCSGALLCTVDVNYGQAEQITAARARDGLINQYKNAA